MYEELQHYTQALRTYITSTYHISNPALVDLRAEMLARSGAIAQVPYLESTAKYTSSRRYKDLSIPSDVAQLLNWLGAQGVVFDPPYDHQAQALELTLTPPYRDLVVTSGTGSGKTETFLLPILGRMAAEARRSEAFSTRAVRALLLYPMNALVNDQLGRLRVLFGDNRVARWFTDHGGRPMKFARYTGRTLYPGRRQENTSKHQSRLKEPLEFFTKLEDRAASDTETKQLISGIATARQVAGQAAHQSGARGRCQRLAGQGSLEARWRVGPDGRASRGPGTLPAARGTGGNSRPPRHQLLDARVHASAAD